MTEIYTQKKQVNQTRPDLEGDTEANSLFVLLWSVRFYISSYCDYILVFTQMPCKQVAEYVVSHGIVQNFVCATVLSYRNSANNFHSLCSFCLSF